MKNKEIEPKKIKIKKPVYSLGEKHVNKYLGCSFTEVLDEKKNRLGWIWKHTDGRIVVMPTLGFHVWFNEGQEWTMEAGCNWLMKHSDWR